jgi:hypothetical protein
MFAPTAGRGVPSSSKESPIRLAGRKGRSDGTRSEAEMGPVIIKGVPDPACRSERTDDGTRSEAEMGPVIIKGVPDPACRSERTLWWDSKRSGDGARQREGVI